MSGACRLLQWLASGVWLTCSAAAAQGQVPGPVFRDCADCPEMVVVPAGRFAMGTAPGEEDREGLAVEFRHRSEPQRPVVIARFAVGKFEITRGQFRLFAEAEGRAVSGCFVWDGGAFDLQAAKSWRNTGYTQDDNHPAACVSWEDALAYTRWLSTRTGKPYRLLSEAEWEYAARAGSASPRFWGDDAQQVCAHANGADRSARLHAPHARTWGAVDCDDRYAFTAPVGSYRANAFGLYDMLGNVGEWTADCWNVNYQGAPATGRAWFTGDCSQRAVRGGAWDDDAVGLRSAYRVGSPVVIRLYSRGFRVARDLSAE